MPVQIFDLEGALLAEAAAPTTSDAAVASDADVPLLTVQGRDLPGFGPTSVPTLARLGRTPVVAEHGTAASPPPAGDGRPDDREAHGEADDGAGEDGAGEDGAGQRLDDAPSGSALSTLDAVALFGEAARDRFAAG